MQSENVPEYLRMAIWDIWIGHEKTEGYCQTGCGTKIYKTIHDVSESIKNDKERKNKVFIAGHIIAYNGPQQEATIIANLIPICLLCNVSMQQKSMLDYIQEKGYESNVKVVDVKYLTRYFVKTRVNLNGPVHIEDLVRCKARLTNDNVRCTKSRCIEDLFCSIHERYLVDHELLPVELIYDGPDDSLKCDDFFDCKRIIAERKKREIEVRYNSLSKCKSDKLEEFKKILCDEYNKLNMYKEEIYIEWNKIRLERDQIKTEKFNMEETKKMLEQEGIKLGEYMKMLESKQKKSIETEWDKIECEWDRIKIQKRLIMGYRLEISKCQQIIQIQWQTQINKEKELMWREANLNRMRLTVEQKEKSLEIPCQKETKNNEENIFLMLFSVYLIVIIIYTISIWL